MRQLIVLVVFSVCIFSAMRVIYTTQFRSQVVIRPFVVDSESVGEGEDEETDSPDQAIKQDFVMRYDPAINRVPTERLIAAQQAAQTYTNSITQQPPPGGSVPVSSSIPMAWTEMGPSNVGGRTRTFLVDRNVSTNERVWAGGVGGGLWRCNNISSSSSSWSKINDQFDNLAVTTIAQNPTNPQYMYFGTGEGWYNQDAIQGAGIWRSIDGGVSWTRLSITANSNFFFVNKIVVASNGDVYAATRNGVYRSKTSTDATNNVAAWELVLGGSGVSGYDLEIAANGTIFASIGVPFSTGLVYKSTTGNAGSWVQIVTGLSSSFLHRIELACAPNDANVLYAMVAGTNGTAAICDNSTLNGYSFRGVYKSVDGGSNWTLCTFPIDSDNCIAQNSDMCRGASWYDMAIAVDPNNANTVYVGGIDLFKSINGGSNWTQLSHWQGTGSQYVHADQHAIVFNPNSSAVIYFTNDGGIYRTANGTASVPTLVSKNKNYNVTQFYAGAIKNTSAEFYALCGSQDNGTQKFTINSYGATSTATGGDGGFCHIDSQNSLFQFTSFPYNTLSRSVDGGNTFSELLSSGTGRFINPSDYDDEYKVLYAAGNAGDVIRRRDLTASSPPLPDIISITAMAGRKASHIKVSPNTSTTVYVATGHEGGLMPLRPKVFKLNNANGSNISVQDITTDASFGGSLPGISGYISCVEVERGNEQHIIITLSNFGLVSKVYETTNGGTNWTAVWNTNTSQDIPIYWALFDPYNSDRVLLATDVGVWSTLNLDGVNTIWSPSNSGFMSGTGSILGNVRVDMLVLRPSDNTVLAVTHGRGLFKSSSLIPAANFSVSYLPACSNKVNNFVDLSTGTVVSWAWDFNGDNIVDSNLKNPVGICGGIGVPVKLTITTIDGQTLSRTKTISGSPCFGTPCSGKMAFGSESAIGLEISPNPFSYETKISYSLEEAANVSIRVFDMQGKLVSVPMEHTLQGIGNYSVGFNGSSLANGVYYVVLNIGSKQKTVKVVCTH